MSSTTWRSESTHSGPVTRCFGWPGHCSSSTRRQSCSPRRRPAAWSQRRWQWRPAGDAGIRYGCAARLGGSRREVRRADAPARRGRASDLTALVGLARAHSGSDDPPAGKRRRSWDGGLIAPGIPAPARWSICAPTAASVISPRRSRRRAQCRALAQRLRSRRRHGGSVEMGAAPCHGTPLTALNQVRATMSTASRRQPSATVMARLGCSRPAPVAAMGLRRRCDTADLWESALLGDRLCGTAPFTPGT
ncbi:hypothetical protein I552_0712 [Mycobacterium xenopi 3993]|nr:hypothetical protein I552_0712 [Mycobacterium xenopi 3993]